MSSSNLGAKVGWSNAQVSGGGERFLCPLFVVLLFVAYPLSNISFKIIIIFEHILSFMHKL